MSEGTARPAVVVAEDDEDIARVLEEALRSDGVEPVLVSNGALVADAVIGSGARLLILDVQMPGASGIDVYDVVRNHPALVGVAVLFVTANPEIARGTLRGGARREVMAKPFDVDDLVKKVRELLAEEVTA